MSGDDIVARLRAVLHDDRSVELMAREAADEIERLREELATSNENAERANYRAIQAQADAMSLRARCNILMHKLQELEVRDV